MTEIIIRYAEPSAEMDRAVIPSEVVGTLVRCKDCEHWHEKACMKFLATHPSDADDYCSYGERAEQTEYKLPGHDEVMEKLGKLTIKQGGNNHE